MRVLFMAMHRPGRAPSQRFRYEQYLPYLRAHGVECEVSFLLDERDDEIFYRPGRILAKARIAARSWRQRRRETTPGRLARYDAVFVQREALFFGPPVIERRVAAGGRLVFDLDDAIWIPAISGANRLFGWLKHSQKTAECFRLAALTIAGNHYLAEHAAKNGARRVEIIPTTIDTDAYAPRAAAPGGSPVCIGWTGSFSTIKHLELALPALRAVKRRFGDRVVFRVIGDPNFRDAELDVSGVAWRPETEVADLHPIDIGIMPLPDDPWSRGKCALKGLQYMALAIPTVMSPVGVNAEIISHRENGLLATRTEEWVECLSELVLDPRFRRVLGGAGRATVEARYSVKSQASRYLEVLRSLG